jgi:hypothetical protein
MFSEIFFLECKNSARLRGYHQKQSVCDHARDHRANPPDGFSKQLQADTAQKAVKNEHF